MNDDVMQVSQAVPRKCSGTTCLVINSGATISRYPTSDYAVSKPHSPIDPSRPLTWRASKILGYRLRVLWKVATGAEVLRS